MIRITSTARNAGPFAFESVRSVLEQRCPTWALDFFDAASTDGTLSEVARALPRGWPDARVRIHGEERPTGSLAKLIPFWRSLPPSDIVVWLDGDDRLATDRALDVVAAAHAAGAVVTYGQFIWPDGRWGGCAPIGHGHPTHRAGPWRASHLKTFRAGLIRDIPNALLVDGAGAFHHYATDRAVMLPLLDLAGHRSAFLPNVLCCYSGSHGTPTAADRAAEAVAVARIAHAPPLLPLDDADLIARFAL